MKRKKRLTSGAVRRANNADYLLTVCLCVNTDHLCEVEVTLTGHETDQQLICCLERRLRQAEGTNPTCAQVVRVTEKLTEKRANRDNDGERLHTSKWMKLDVLHSK